MNRKIAATKRGDRGSEETGLTVGECLSGRYRVLGWAAHGGMGSLYHAEDLERDEPVAIKVVSQRHNNPRFAREAKVLSDLSHPAIVRYIDHGFTPTRAPFLVMEWLSGADLAALLRERGLTVEESLALIRRVCEALAAAHARGVVHRDVKPSNIFVVDLQPAQAKVLDFGVARVATAVDTLTRAGETLGTVGYMAPEQAMGIDDIDERADVFSIGCVLFECLTGRPAFVGSHSVALLAKLLRDDPPPISELRPELGTRLDKLVQRMLEKERDLRPVNAQAVLDELDRLGAQRGSAPPPVKESTRLTGSEQRIVSIILGGPSKSSADLADTVVSDATEVDARRIRELATTYSAEAVPLPGGGILLLLGARAAATDLAQNAALCSLALRELRPDLSVALATGLVDTSGRLPVGAAIDRAAAVLTSEPEQAGVAIDDLTASLLTARFNVRETAAGLRLYGEADEADVPRSLLGKTSPHVGRVKELQMLDATFTQCKEEEVVQIVLVTGPPGIGKSRLRIEFLNSLRQRRAGRVLIAGADPVSAGATLALAQRLIRDAARIRQSDPETQQRAQLHDYVSGLPSTVERPWLSEFLAELLSISVAAPSPLLRAARNDPEIMRAQVQRAFSAWLEAEARRGPLVLSLDDLHWADIPTLSYLQTALERLESCAVMVLALARPEVHDLAPKLWNTLDVQELRLHGLTHRAAERLARAVLSEPVDPNLIERIVELADGNAFYLEELIRCVAEGRTSLPESVLTMAQSRLEQLEPEARRVLRASSVYGETFWVSAVRALLGDPADVNGWLKVLTERELVTPRRESRFPEQREYAFRHSLLRDAAYGMLTPENRQLAHRLAADWLVNHGEREARALSDHFERGGESGRALPWLMRAVVAALEAGDYRETIALSCRALELGAVGHDEGVLHLLKAYAEAITMQASMDAEGVAEALALLEPSTPYWWLALSLLIFLSSARGRPEQALPYLQLAHVTPPGPELTGMYGYAMQALAAGMVLMGRNEAAWQLLERFDGITAEGDHCDLTFVAWLNSARCQLALTAPVRGTWQLERALCWGRAAESAMRAAGSSSGQVAALFYVGNALRVLGCYEEAERTLAQCIELAEGTGNARFYSFARLMLSLIWIRTQRAEEALAVLTTLAESHDVNLSHGARAIMAEAYLRCGSLEQALHLAEESVVGPGSPYRRMAQATLARAHVRLGNVQAAKSACLCSLEEKFSANPEFEADLLVTLAEAELALGDRAGAEATIRSAVEYVRSTASTIASPSLYQSFVQGVEANVRIVELAERMGEGGTLLRSYT